MIFHGYGLMVGIAIVVGWSVAEKIEPEVNKAVPGVLLLGFMGARLYHVIDMWGYYSRNLGQILAVWNGGLSIWGAIIGGVLGLWIYFKGDSLKVMAAAVTGLPLAQAIGRIGNGINGEFVQKVGILPWWGVEAILDLMLFGVMWSLRGQSSKVRVGVYLVGYALIRLVLQPYRG